MSPAQRDGAMPSSDQTPVEADHQRGAGRAHHIETGADARGIEIDRLFAEHRLAGADGALDQIGMDVGRCADHHRIDVPCRDDRINRADCGAGRQRKALRRRGIRIGDRRKLARGCAAALAP
jgi:hypothetical protein